MPVPVVCPHIMRVFKLLMPTERTIVHTRSQFDRIFHIWFSHFSYSRSLSLPLHLHSPQSLENQWSSGRNEFHEMLSHLILIDAMKWCSFIHTQNVWHFYARFFFSYHRQSILCFCVSAVLCCVRVSYLRLAFEPREAKRFDIKKHAKNNGDAGEKNK